MANLPRHPAPHLTFLVWMLLATAAAAAPPDEAPAKTARAPETAAPQAAQAARSEPQASEVQTDAQAAQAARSEPRLAQASDAAAPQAATAARSEPKASEVKLLGTWHVLVHYTDENTAHPETMRWEDRVWVFETAGSRLRWSDYPIVVFRDKTGRFKALGTNRASRVLHAWEPDEDQRAQIASGLEVNPRGVKTKTLRGSSAKGWHSRGRPTAASASVITYTENWSISGLPELPIFERVDVLGSARTESMDGVTRYATTEVDAGGDVLRGRFERDDTRKGTFRMTLAAPVAGVKGSGKSEGERVYDLFFGEAGAALFRSDEKALQRRAARGEEIPEELRAEVREEIRRKLERSLRRKGVDPAAYQREVETLSRQIEKQILDEGRSPEEVERMIEEGEIEP